MPKTSPAEDLIAGEDILINLNGVMCDVTIDEVSDLDDARVEVKHHTRSMPGSYIRSTILPRFHSIRILEKGE